MRKLFPVCVFLLMTLSAMPASAEGLVLDKVIVNFRPAEKPIDNINVTNQSEKPLKVTVQTIEAINSDLSDQKEIPTDQLVVAPKAFEIAPGETRPVRLVLRSFPDDKEAVYRVRFEPSTPTIRKTQEIEGKAVNIDMIVSMGALIMVSPKNPKPDFKFTREGDKIKFTNAGNLTVQLQREDFCTEGRVLCVPLEGARLFSGTTWEMTVPEKLKGMAFTQTVLIDGKYSSLSYPAP